MMENFTSDHSRLEERSLALHALVASKLQADPALLDKARDNLRRWRQAQASLSPALMEWEQILKGRVDHVVTLLRERSQRAARLRQSSPFGGILTEPERRTIYESYAT